MNETLLISILAASITAGTPILFAALGELISETYQTELETLSAWMAQPDTREVILDARAREAGFSWFQEPGGKIWWTMLTGG